MVVRLPVGGVAVLVGVIVAVRVARRQLFGYFLGAVCAFKPGGKNNLGAQFGQNFFAGGRCIFGKTQGCG